MARAPRRSPDPAAETPGNHRRELGAAVRSRRRQLGLTLGDVAERTGLSVPFLSQIETDFATPSLTSLFAVAEVLATSPERLLTGPEPAEVVVTRTDEGERYPVTETDRPAMRRQLTGVDEPFSVAEYVAGPGSDLSGFHASQGRELIHVTAGRLAVDIDDDGQVTTHELGPGDSIAYPTHVRHRWRRIGRSTSRFLHVVSAP
ncbi:MAG: helix-turn-helix domain-containing protein [Desertimonas sp.]